MKEKLTFPFAQSHKLLGVETWQDGPVMITDYYFSGWIPMAELTNGLRPFYVTGFTGKETLVRVESIKPALTINVSPQD